MLIETRLVKPTLRMVIQRVFKAHRRQTKKYKTFFFSFISGVLSASLSCKQNLNASKDTHFLTYLLKDHAQAILIGYDAKSTLGYVPISNYTLSDENFLRKLNTNAD